MPRRSDLKRVLIIGSGPIVIGQACEFDYSGSQACKALRAEGLEVILVNSNPATIMTDPELADRTYVEPLTPEVLAQIIERERPDALLRVDSSAQAVRPALQSLLGLIESEGADILRGPQPLDFGSPDATIPRPPGAVSIRDTRTVALKRRE